MMNSSLKASFLGVLFTAAAVIAHPDHGTPQSSPQPSQGEEPAPTGQRGSQVSITERGDKRIVESNDIPNHSTGPFPNPQNPNRISPQHFHFEMPLHPKETGEFMPLGRYNFGVALNGVKFDPGTAEFWRNDPSLGWREEAIVDGRGRLGMDKNNAHVQPDGAYHYHGIPTGLIRKLNGEGKMVQVGWAADGFPIYGPLAYKDAKDSKSELVEMKSSYRLKSGTRPSGNEGPGGRYDGKYTRDFEFVKDSGDLDEANGRTGVTPEFPDGTYYYVLTKDFPYVPRFFRGTPDASFLHEEGGAPPGMQQPGQSGQQGSGQRPPPPPPRGGHGPPPPPQ